METGHRPARRIGATDKMNSRPLRVTFVFEYAPAGDVMMESLISDLQKRLPGLRATCLCGLFPTYRPGGFRPKRIANLIWVYLRVALHLLISRPDAVLVRTSPPGVQLWTVWWAGLRRIPTFCWLMDYHPEIEARQLEKKGSPMLARLLRRIDADLMPRFAAIIALDRAMASQARMRAAGAEVVQYPTWATNRTTPDLAVSYTPGGERTTLRLAYSGNLGVAHDLSVLTQLLRRIVQSRPVSLLVVGASAVGEERFRQLGANLGMAVEVKPRIPFAELRALYEERKIDAGVVLLSAESAGLVSPSKFSGYINFGIPLIYLGPADTNTAEVCIRFGGGFWISTEVGAEKIDGAVAALLDPERMAAAAAGARAAAKYFAALNSGPLADLLADRLLRLGVKSSFESSPSVAGESKAIP
jgi:hypothetical protein